MMVLSEMILYSIGVLEATEEVWEATEGKLQIYSSEKINEENTKQLRGEIRGGGTESRHAPPPTPTELMTQGVKYRRYHREALAVGSVDFCKESSISRGNIRSSSRKEKQPTGTQGIHQSLNSTIKKALDLSLIHVVKPHVLTTCKPHQRLDRSRYRAEGRGVSGCTD